MRNGATARHWRSWLMIAGVSLVSASCESDVTGDATGQPQVASMRILIANQLLTIDQNGQPSGSVVMHAGVQAPVAATFFKVNGEPDPRVTPGAYQLNLTVLSSITAWTFERSTTNPFGGTLQVNVGIGTVHIRFSLHHVEEGKDLWGPFDATITVN